MKKLNHISRRNFPLDCRRLPWPLNLDPFRHPMRTLHLSVFLTAMLISIIARSVRADAAPEGILIDRVWSGHPVGFALLTERGQQFIAYYDAERRITVAGRRLSQTEWARFQPPGRPMPTRGRDSNIIGWDSHNYLALSLDREGYLHLSGNMHVDPLIYYRSSRPFDVTSLEKIDRMTGRHENRVTYPVFFKNAAGDLLFRYRDGSSGNGVDIYNRYDPATRIWESLLDSPLLDGEGERNAYANRPRLGPDGRFHLIWVWRDTPDCSTNHSLGYARSADLKNWEKSDGTPLKLPITLANGDMVDAAPVKHGLVNMTINLGFDQRKRPVVVYHRYDKTGLSQAFAARPSGEGASWTCVQISDWTFRWDFSGNGSVAAEVKLGSPSPAKDGTLQVDFSTTHEPVSGRFRLDAETLGPLELLPTAAGTLPDLLAGPWTPDSGLEMQSSVSRADGRRWVLRWETLPRNRDQPRPSAPPPAEMFLYELPDT